MPQTHEQADAALLAAFDAVRAGYRNLVEEARRTRCNATERRRLLSHQRATYRAALTLLFALVERDCEAAR